MDKIIQETINVIKTKLDLEKLNLSKFLLSFLEADGITNKRFANNTMETGIN